MLKELRNLDDWLIDTKGSNKQFADTFFQTEQYWLDSTREQLEEGDVTLIRNYHSKEMCLNSQLKLALRIFKEFKNVKIVGVYQTLVLREHCYKPFDYKKTKMLSYNQIDILKENYNK